MRPIQRDPEAVDKRNRTRRPHSSDVARTSGTVYGRKETEDGPMQPVNYSGTQVNIFGSPSPEYVNEMLQRNRPTSASYPAASAADPEAALPMYYPYGPLYPPRGFTNQIQFGFMTEHMLRKLDESRFLTMSELCRRSSGDRYQQAPPTPRVQEPPSPPRARPRQAPPPNALEYNISPKPVSPGNGDWRGQIKHIYAHILDIASEDRNFRISIGEPKLGEIVSADLEEEDDSYSLTLKFEKPPSDERRKIGPVATADRQPDPNTPVSTNRKFNRSYAESPTKDRAYQRAASTDNSVRSQRGRGVDASSSRRQPVTKGPVTPPIRKQMLKEDSQFEKENIQQDGTVKPFKQFNAEMDAETLRKAMKGVGTDEDAITNVFGKRSSSQRQEIIKIYKTLYGKDLIKDLKSELSGDYWNVVQGLCQSHVDYDANELRKAIKGLGTDDETLIEIICTRNNKSLTAIDESYKRLFNKTLEDDIMGDTSGHYQRLLVALLQANRDESNVVDRNLAKNDAQDMHNAGAGIWGTDESRFNAILVKRSYPQLRATFEEYEAIAGKSIEEAISSEMSGNLAKGVLTIVQCVKSKVAYFAQRLYKAMKGVGTDDVALIRIVVSRCEIDMVQIKDEFQRLYKQSLAQFISDDTSGDYRKILLTLLGESNAAKKL